MAITSGVMAQQMGRVLAEAVRDEPRIAEVWVATHPDAIQLWLICVPITLAEHRVLFRHSRPRTTMTVTRRSARNQSSDRFG